MNLNDEIGKFFLCAYSGSVMAFGFEGEPDFIRRSFNMCANYSITKGKLYNLYGNMHYVVTNNEKLTNGLKQCFRNEIEVSKGKYHYPVDGEGDLLAEQIYLDNEAEVAQIADREAHKFIEEKIIKQRFITSK
jgi:hypothetical protein